MARQFLRRRLAPYVGQLAILGAVSLFCGIVAVEKDEPKLGLAVLTGWVLFAPLVYFGLSYRVAFDQEGILQQVSGGKDVFIPYSAIAKVDIETSKEMMTGARPYRRVAIYGRSKGAAARVDVSLKHFPLPDIRALLSALRAARPDLGVPDL